MLKFDHGKVKVTYLQHCGSKFKKVKAPNTKVLYVCRRHVMCCNFTIKILTHNNNGDNGGNTNTNTGTNTNTKFFYICVFVWSPPFRVL